MWRAPRKVLSEMNNQPQVIHVANPTTYSQRRPTKTQSLLEVMTEPLDHLPTTTNANINTLWRYMDWWKYEDLIASRALWMSTAKTLDKGEGLQCRRFGLVSACPLGYPSTREALQQGPQPHRERLQHRKEERRADRQVLPCSRRSRPQHGFPSVGGGEQRSTR